MSLVAFEDERRRPTGPVLAPICAKAGPLSPEKCKVLPPGIGRATTGIPFMVTLQSFDANDRKIYEGGARVKLKALRLSDADVSNEAPGLPPGLAGGERIEGTVKDNRDGTYTLTLCVAEGGKYRVDVEVNSIHVEDSPFSLTAISLPRAGAAGVSPTAAPSRSEAKDPGVSQQRSPSPFKPIDLRGEDLSRVLNVANISPQVSIEELRKVFEFFGEIRECAFAGGARDLALVKFSTREEAAKAAEGLNEVQVGDRPIRVQVAGGPSSGVGVGIPKNQGDLVLMEALGCVRQQMEARGIPIAAAAAATKRKRDPLEVAKERAREVSERILSRERETPSRRDSQG